jgi:hypothetical protein
VLQCRNHGKVSYRRIVMSGFWGSPVAAGHEDRRLVLTHCGLAAKKDDAAQQGVGSPVMWWTAPAPGIEVP